METSYKTLPARYYTSPEIFRQEIESFYCQSWICAGRADAIPNPGDYFLRDVAEVVAINGKREHVRFSLPRTNRGHDIHPSTTRHKQASSFWQTMRKPQ